MQIHIFIIKICSQTHNTRDKQFRETDTHTHTCTETQIKKTSETEN